MTPKRDRLFKKACSAELLEIAEGDLESAKVLHESSRGRVKNLDIMQNNA
ncbi:MAG: hypothetical protein RI953_1231 [Pseudomonadota bacterium]|jgi:hypothetical protein